MSVPKRYLLHGVALVLLSSFVLTGCTSKDSTAVPPTEIHLQNSNASQRATVAVPLASPVASPTSTSASSVLGKSSMKSLNDFEPIVGTEVTLNTNKGAVVFTLFREKAPLTTLNFLTLAKSGFYDGILFHRVIPDFMAQFGDPLTKDPSKKALWGTGSAGYTIPDEFSPDLKHDSEGTVSMANSGPNSGGSQIFITYAATPWLDGKHAVFGKVTTGMDVLRQLENGDQIISVSFK